MMSLWQRRAIITSFAWHRSNTMMKFIKNMAVILLALGAVLLTSCTAQVQISDNGEGEPIFQTVDDENSLKTAKLYLDNMTLEEKIGQMFIIRPEALAVSGNAETAHAVDSLTDVMRGNLEKYAVGGIAVFSRNITGAEQLPEFIADLQNNSKYPLFIAVDEEGGNVARVANSGFFKVAGYKSMAEVGKTDDPAKAEEVGRKIGFYLKKLGFNFDFAPVADVNTNPYNIVIGDRSYGSDPVTVGKMVSAQLNGMHQSGVIGTLKHFPGHGDTKDDTHSGYVSVEKTWDELRNCELIPFVSALDKADTVMVSHITVNSEDKLPSSLSYEIITRRLRNELGYNGVVITDSMAMGAVADNYTSAAAAVMAVKAGADIILMPENFEEAFSGVLDSVKSGEISTSRIDESAERILTLKAKYKLI